MYEKKSYLQLAVSTEHNLYFKNEKNNKLPKREKKDKQDFVVRKKEKKERKVRFHAVCIYRTA